MHSSCQDLGQVFARQMHIYERPLHRPCGNQYRLGLPDPSASSHLDLPLKYGDEEQAHHRSGVWLRSIVSLFIPSQYNDFVMCLLHYSAVISSIMRLVYAVKLSQTSDFTWASYPVALWS